MATHVSGDDACEDALSHELIPARSQVEIETQTHGQADADQGVYIISTVRSLDNLMQREGTAANNPPVHGGQSRGSSNEEPPKVQMIGDFDDGANALWTLYGKEAKSHDQSRIQTLKEDMDVVLIFVSSYSYFCLCYILNHAHSLSHRLVYSLLPSPLSLPIAYRACSQTPHNKPPTTWNKTSQCSHRSLTKSLPSLHKSPFLPHHRPLSLLSSHCHPTFV
jgi:hypothetical protein